MAPHFLHFVVQLDSNMIAQSLIDDVVTRALAEDIGPGDMTTAATVLPQTQGFACILAKSPGVICGLEVASAAFRIVDVRIVVAAKITEGGSVTGTRDLVAEINGPAAGILTAERVALNFLQRLSGIATVTAQYVACVAGTNAKIIDTRKTTPGLRVFEKYAVRCAGGFNHRFGLNDGVLIKDNHIEAAGGIRQAVERARNYAPHLMKIEVEVKGPIR